MFSRFSRKPVPADTSAIDYDNGMREAMRLIIAKELVTLEATAILFSKIECDVPNSFADGFLDRTDRFRIACFQDAAKKQRRARGSH